MRQEYIVFHNCFFPATVTVPGAVFGQRDDHEPQHEPQYYRPGAQRPEQERNRSVREPEEVGHEDLHRHYGDKWKMQTHCGRGRFGLVRTHPVTLESMKVVLSDRIALTPSRKFGNTVRIACTYLLSMP